MTELAVVGATPRDLAKKAVVDALVEEYRHIAVGFDWEHVPALVVHGVKHLAELSDFTGPEKKEIIIAALIELCPDDEIDVLIEPVIDVVWALLKMVVESQTCCRCYTCNVL